jgi:predicted DNA-binding transcriptional regulator AlpA
MDLIEPLYDESQVANLIGRSVASLQKDRVSGRGPVFVKLGRSVRYKPADLRAWIDARARHSTSEPAE